MIVDVAGVVVTLFSIFTTCISIWQNHRNRENQKNNRPEPKE